jgi:hypothetical protein
MDADMIAARAQGWAKEKPRHLGRGGSCYDMALLNKSDAEGRSGSSRLNEVKDEQGPLRAVRKRAGQIHICLREHAIDAEPE